MNATKKLAAAIILLVAASAFTIPALVKDIKNPDGGQAKNTDLILYYGDTCPHCKVVEEYIAANRLEEKLSLSQKEVFNNQNNNSELAARAKICGIDLGKLGVPLLWDGTDSKCYEGDQAITDFLKQEAQLP
jgi:hypothetical protein